MRPEDSNVKMDCPDGSDEMCNDPCVPDNFAGSYTMKVIRSFSQRLAKFSTHCRLENVFVEHQFHSYMIRLPNCHTI